MPALVFYEKKSGQGCRLWVDFGSAHARHDFITIPARDIGHRVATRTFGRLNAFLVPPASPLLSPPVCHGCACEDFLVFLRRFRKFTKRLKSFVKRMVGVAGSALLIAYH